MSIPRVIHRIWLGGPEPAEYVDFEAAWRRLHPGWEVRTWGEHDLGWLANRAVFDDAPSYSSKANVARYEIVLREGGLYVDADFEPLRPFDDLVEGADLVLGEQEPGLYACGLFAAVPGHPVLAYVVDQLPRSHHARAEADSPTRTGPDFFTRAVRRAVAELGVEPRVLARDEIYPYTWTQPHLRHADFPEAAAVHHWAGTWVTPAPVGVTSVDGSSVEGSSAEAPPPASTSVGASPGPADAPSPSASPDHAVDVRGRRPVRSARRVAGALRRRIAVALAPPAGGWRDLVRSPVRAPAPAQPEPSVEASPVEAPGAGPAGAPELAEGPAPVPAPAPTPAPASQGAAAPRATYLGSGRLLVVADGGLPLLAPADDLLVTPSLVLDGTTDPGYRSFLERELYGGAVAVDVGAGIGLGTLAMAHAVHRPGRVFAFEPAPDAAQLLRDSLEVARNRRLQADVVVHEVAAGATPGATILRVPTRHGALATTNPTSPLPEGAAVRTHRVEVVRLDDVLRAVAAVDLLRIDVAGAEAEVLAGASALLAGGRVRLLDVHLADVRAAATWSRLVARLAELIRAHDPVTFTVGPDGGRVPLSFDAAVHHDEVVHLVLELGPSPGR